MAEGGNRSGSFHNETSTSEQIQRASKESGKLCLGIVKAPRGNPKAATLKWWSVSDSSSQRGERAKGQMLVPLNVQPRNWSPLLCTCLTLALRTYYIEVSSPVMS